MRVQLPTVTPRLVVLVAAGLVVLLLGGFAAVQARAGQAQERRDQAAAQAAQDEADRRAADREAERLAAAELAAQWAVTTADAATRLTAAEAVLAGSEAKVADDAVRLALADAIAAVRDATELEGDPDDAAVQHLTQSLAAMGTAQTRVTEAQTAWQAEQDAAAAQAQAEAEAAQTAQAQADAARRAPAPSLGGPPSTGAGPDCGGPDSYEPPKNTGPTFYTSTPNQTGSGGNGDIPAGQMAPLGWCVDSQGNNQWLRSAAAAALTTMNEAFRAQFGENIAVDMSYRSYQTQVEMRQAFGSVAALPGTSNHGTGLAFDTWEWQAYAFGSARYDWLVAHGPEYGWVAPDWARQDGSNPEYWHFEYVG